MAYKLRKADFLSESAVYGLVLVSALLMVTNRYDATSLEVFLKVTLTVGVFWIAHFFATAVSHLGHVDDKTAPIRESVQFALVHSLGMLISSAIPLAIIGLGVINVVHDDFALWTALWVDVVLLGLLGYATTGNWSSRPMVRVAVGLSTASLGVLIIVLKALIH